MRQAMKTAALKYVTSELFIHDGLLRDCAKLIDRLYGIWGRDKKIRPSLLLFPADYIADDRGRGINGVVAMELDKEPDHRSAIRGAIERTKAYAFFYVRTDGQQVRALLESPHGTREWVLPISRSADVDILGSPRTTDGTDGLGLLWSKNQGHS